MLRHVTTLPLIEELWRFPVKTLRGERLDEAQLGVDGIRGDRIVHLRDVSGRVVTARLQPGLLGLAGSLGPDWVPMIDGHRWDSDAARQAVRAASAPDATPLAFTGPDEGQRYDVLPLTVVSDGMATAVGVDRRRFRSNIVIGGVAAPGERDWVISGGRLRTGQTVEVVDLPAGTDIPTGNGGRRATSSAAAAPATAARGRA